MFKLIIKTGNAAFEDNKAEAIASILRDIATTLTDLSEGANHGAFTDSVQDFNGNTVGNWSLR